MKVCFFGSYTKDPVISVLKLKLELLNIEVIECHEDINISLDHISIPSVIKSFIKLFFKHRKVDYDIAVLPLWWGAIQIRLLKLISRKPVLYFGQGSPYDELVHDRKKVKPNSFTAKFFYYFERMVCKYSDLITKESQAEIDYFTNQMKLSKEKFRVLLMSADESKFPVCSFKKPEEIFQILYWGTFIPLHGVEVIIEAAKILAGYNDILFKFCGDGQTKEQIEELARKYELKNVKFLGFVEQKVLIDLINKSDICLGLFGHSTKASIVVTNKVYQILCSQKPLITMDSKVINEIGLESGKNCILVPKQDPKKLADAILDIKNDVKTREKIAIQGRQIFEEKFSLKKTSEQLQQILHELLQKNSKLS